MCVVGDANAAGLRNPFKPSGDIDAVAKDIVVIDNDVADVDADPKFNPPDLAAQPAFCSAMPRCTSIAQRAASTALANSTSMPSPVVLTIRPRCSATVGSTRDFRVALRPNQCAFFVRAHQATISSDIRRQDSCKPPFHTIVGHNGPRDR